MEFFKVEPEEPANEEVEYYKPENLENLSANGVVSIVNLSPTKPKAPKKRKKTRRFVLTTPKRRNRKKKDPSVSTEQSNNLTSLEDSLSNISRELLSNDSSDTVILSDGNASQNKFSPNDLEFPLTKEILAPPEPIVSVAGKAKKTRQRKGNKRTLPKIKNTENSLSSVLPIPPETFTFSKVNSHKLTNSQPEPPDSNIAKPNLPNQGLSIDLSGSEMFLDSVSKPVVEKKEPMKRARSQTSRSRKKQNTGGSTIDYSALDETINFVASASHSNQYIDDVPVEKPLKRTARKKTGGNLTASHLLRELSTPYCDDKISLSPNQRLTRRSAGKTPFIPNSTSIAPGVLLLKTDSLPIKNSPSRATTEGIPLHVNLTFEEDVTEKQNFPEDISHLLAINEKLLNSNKFGHSKLITTNCSKENEISQNSNSNLSNSSVTLVTDVLSGASSSQVKIKTEVIDNHSEPNLPLVSNDTVAPLNIKKEVEDNESVSPCSLSMIFNASNHVSEILGPQTIDETDFPNLINSVRIKSETESAPKTHALDAATVQSPTSHVTSLSTPRVLGKESEKSIKSSNSKETPSHAEEVGILSVAEKTLKKKEIEVICLDDSSSDSISFEPSESNATPSETIKEGLTFNLGNSQVLACTDKSLPTQSSKNASDATSSISDTNHIHITTSSILDTSSVGRNVVDSQVITHELNIGFIKKEVDDSPSCTATEDSAIRQIVIPTSECGNSVLSDLTPEVGINSIGLVSSSNESDTQPHLSNVDRTIESVIQNAGVADAIIEHPFDLLMSIKKEVAFEDGCIDSNETINLSTPIPDNRNNINSINTNTSLVTEKQDMLILQSRTDMVDSENSVVNPDLPLALLPEKISGASEANSIIGIPLIGQEERDELNFSKDQSTSFDSTNNASVIDEVTGSNIEDVCAINSNNDVMDCSANTLDSVKSITSNVASNEVSSNIGSNRGNASVSEHENDSRCSFSSSATSFSLSENQSLANQIAQKQHAFDIDFAERVTIYLKKIRNELENSKLSCEVDKEETDNATALRENQSYEEELDMAESSNSELPSCSELKTDLADEYLCEQESQDGMPCLDSVEKLHCNMDRYFKNSVPPFLTELYDHEDMNERLEQEKIMYNEIFPYDVVAANLQAAPELSLNSVILHDGIELKIFPVVEEEIECYYRLLNVAPRLISTSDVSDFKNVQKTERIDVKIESEKKENTEDGTVAHCDTKEVDDSAEKPIVCPAAPVDINPASTDNCAMEVDEVKVDGVEKLALPLKSEPDASSIASEENSKDASQSAGCSNERLSAVPTENLENNDLNETWSNIDSEMEVDVELRQLACESIKNLSSAETESNDMIELNFENELAPRESTPLPIFSSPDKSIDCQGKERETTLPTSFATESANIPIIDLGSPEPSSHDVDSVDNTAGNEAAEKSSCEEVSQLNDSVEIVSEVTKSVETETALPPVDVGCEKETVCTPVAECDTQLQEGPLENVECSKAQLQDGPLENVECPKAQLQEGPLENVECPKAQLQEGPLENVGCPEAQPTVDVSVIDLLSILQAAKSLPTAAVQTVDVKCVQSYDYGHGIKQKAWEKQDSYSEPAYCSSAGDFYSPNIQFEIVHEYGHKPPVESESLPPPPESSTSADQCLPKDLPVSSSKDDRPATREEDAASEDEFYTVESEFICNSDAEDGDRDTTEPPAKKKEEKKDKQDEVIEYPEYKSRWERIMERKKSENKEATKKCPPQSEKPMKKPVALVQPCSQTVSVSKPAPIKNTTHSYKLLSAESSKLIPRKRGRDERGKRLRHPKKKKRKLPDDATLLFTPDKASKPKKGLLPTPPSHKRLKGKESETKRVYGRVFNRGTFLTESTSEPQQVKAPKPKGHDKRKRRVERRTEEFHSMVTDPVIDHIPINKVEDPRTANRARFPTLTPKTSVYFKPIGETRRDSFSESSRSPLLLVPPRCKTPLLPDPVLPTTSRLLERTPLLPSPDCTPTQLSFDKPLLAKSKVGFSNPKRSWPDSLSHMPSTSTDDIFSSSRSPLSPSLSGSPFSSGRDSPASIILPPPPVVKPSPAIDQHPSMVPPPPVLVQPPLPAPPPLKHGRTRQTGCVCLPPKTLKPLVGNAVFETFNVLLLILEWNVDWLVQQQKNPEPPPISSTVHRVKNMFTSFEEYYNTYLPLVLLETWQRIYVSWTHLHQAPPYFCQVTSYDVERYNTKVKCQVIFNCVERDKGIFPEEGNIVMVKFGTKEKGGIKILGYLTEVEVSPYNVSDSNHRALARNVKSTSADHLQLLTMTFSGAYTSDDFDMNQLVRIHVLCNIKSILKQNDALLNAKKSPLFDNILNPISDGLRTVTMVARNSDPHAVAVSVSECVKEIIQGIVTMHTIPLLTIVKSVPSSDKLLVLPPLVQKMKESYKTKVLFCTRTSKALADIGFNLESCSARVVIIGKRADVHQKLRKYMVDDLASNQVYETLVNVKKGVPFLDDSIKPEVLHRAKLDVLQHCDVILTLVRNCHDDLIEELCQDGDFVSRMCCILDEANLCTEPEILIPLLYGISKLILIGDPDVPSKVCSKTAAKYSFNKSLFHRAYDLDAMNE